MPNILNSDPDIFAIGDAIEVKNCVLHKSDLIPLAGPANKQARIAATNAVAQLYHLTFRQILYRRLTPTPGLYFFQESHGRSLSQI